MPEMRKLTAAHIDSLSKRGRYSDGGGLYLQIAQTGQKSWVFRYEREGKIRNMGLGGLRKVSLDAAREAAHHAREQLALRIDPLQERDLEKGIDRSKPRGRLKSEPRPRKQLISMRMDADVLEGLRATGKGWLTLVNAVIRQWLKDNGYPEN